MTSSMDGYEDWDFVQTLGEGAYGEVKLALSHKTQEQLAVKIIDTTRDDSVAVNVRKECAILAMTQKSPHPNIIKFIAYKKDGPTHYIFLEFACGGELFDRIIPDEGMERILAQRYFQQLCSGVDHLHTTLGITHRDIKPENLLLDKNDNLQITDFGLSTVFRHQGKTRKMERRCGTPPYAAPEVVAGAGYHAQPADVWSCGIVLVTMLAGELPWDEPSERVKEFVAWKKNKLMYTPWTKLKPDEIEFLQKVLAVKPADRLTIGQIYKEQWFRTEIPMPEVCERQKKKKLKRSLSNEAMAMSQPDFQTRHTTTDSFNTTRHIFDTISFSQPLHPEYMILSQLDLTQGASQATQSILQRLVRRLTRFLIKRSLEQSQTKLEKILTELKLQYKQVTPTQYTVNTVDVRGKILSFKVQLLEMLEQNILLDFRLSKGDGLEFKKSFRGIRKRFDDCIVRAN